jgi:hypothetical protein
MPTAGVCQLRSALTQLRADLADDAERSTFFQCDLPRRRVRLFVPVALQVAFGRNRRRWA